MNRLYERNRKIAESGIFIALFLGLGMLFVYVPNVEFITFITVLSAFIFSLRRTLFIVLSGEFLFVLLNPMGSSLAYPWLFLAQMLSLCLITVFSSIISRSAGRSGARSFAILSSIWGVVMTLLYDLLTGLSFPLASGFDLQQTIASLVTGIPFYGAHIVSNALIFYFIFPKVLQYIQEKYPEYRRAKGLG